MAISRCCAPLSIYHLHKSRYRVVYLDKQMPSHSHHQYGHQSTPRKICKSNCKYNTTSVTFDKSNSPPYAGQAHLTPCRHICESNAL